MTSFPLAPCVIFLVEDKYTEQYGPNWKKKAIYHPRKTASEAQKWWEICQWDTPLVDNEGVLFQCNYGSCVNYVQD